MKLAIDNNISYALCLEGGGARGAYQIGAWKALREAGIKISAVSGTSIGALNGAMIAMDEYDRVVEKWESVRLSDIMDVDDKVMSKLINRDFATLDIKKAALTFVDFVKDHGFDITPLYNWINETISEDKIRKSDKELYIVAYSVTDRKTIEVRARDLKDGELANMLLASAYLPVFRPEPLGGKYYADGGLGDVLPLHILLNEGYRNIIAVRINGVGVERPVKIPNNVKLLTVETNEDLGSILHFDTEHIKRNMMKGYFDTLRVIYNLHGERYCIDNELNEPDALKELVSVAESCYDSEKPNFRELCENIIPRIADKLGREKASYANILSSLMEAAAETAGLERYKLYTISELKELIPAETLCYVTKKHIGGRFLQFNRQQDSSRQPEIIIRSESIFVPEKLNVCLLNDSFPPVIDGVSNAVVNYARVIKARGEDCAVVTPDVPGAVDDYSFPVVRYTSINTTRLAGYRAGYPFSPLTVNSISKMGFNVIHTHCPIASTIMARNLREVIDAPVILTYHTKFDVDIDRAVKGRIAKHSALKMLVDNISACDEVWVVSQGAGESLNQMGYRGDWRVMPNGVDLKKGIAQKSLQQQLIKQYIPEGEYIPVYLFVGRLRWYKGIKIILDGMKKLKDAGKEFVMIFVGGGMDEPDAKKYAAKLGISDCCRFVGSVSDREILRGWYSLADILLFPSTYDTNGLVVREAAACSLATVLIAGSCAAEGVTDGETGFLIEENADSLAELLLNPNMNKEYCKRVGQCAADKIYISWEDSIDNAISRYYEVYDEYKSGRLHRKRIPSDVLFDLGSNITETVDFFRSFH